MRTNNTEKVKIKKIGRGGGKLHVIPLSFISPPQDIFQIYQNISFISYYQGQFLLFLTIEIYAKKILATEYTL